MPDWTNICQKYAGKWVAMKPDHKTVAASGSTLADAQANAKQKGCSETYLTRLPRTPKNFVGPM